MFLGTSSDLDLDTGITESTPQEMVYQETSALDNALQENVSEADPQDNASQSILQDDNLREEAGNVENEAMSPELISPAVDVLSHQETHEEDIPEEFDTHAGDEEALEGVPNHYKPSSTQEIVDMLHMVPGSSEEAVISPELSQGDNEIEEGHGVRSSPRKGNKRPAEDLPVDPDEAVMEKPKAKRRGRPPKRTKFDFDEKGEKPGLKAERH